MKHFSFILPIYFCAVIAIVLTKAVIEENEIVKETKPYINDHDLFFKKLNDSEKGWLMNAAILYDMEYRKPGEIPEIEQPEIPEIEEPIPVGHIHNRDGGFNPYPIPNETPIELMTGILNGQVPAGWQRRFTRWLRSHYNFTTQNFNLYKTTGRFCPPHQPNCPGFGDIGAECCPFG